MLGNKEVMAKNIRYYMDRNGKTAVEICKALGIKQNTFSNWVNAKIYPRIDKIEMMANYFGVPKFALVEEDGPKKNDDMLENLLHSFDYMMKMNDEEEKDRIKKALRLFDLYESAIPEIRAAVDGLLKSAQPKQ